MSKLTIDVYIRQCKKKDGTTFNTFYTYDENGKRLDVSFRKTANTSVLKENCKMTGEFSNVAMGGKYPVMWFSEIYEIQSIERKTNLEKFFPSLAKEIEK